MTFCRGMVSQKTHPSELEYVNPSPPPVSRDMDVIDYPLPDEDIMYGIRNKRGVNLLNASIVGSSAPSFGLAGLMFKDKPSVDLITFVNKPTPYMKLVRPKSILCKRFTPPQRCRIFRVRTRRPRPHYSRVQPLLNKSDFVNGIYKPMTLVSSVICLQIPFIKSLL